MFTNLSAVVSHAEYSARLVEIVMTLLEDPQLEVSPYLYICGNV